MAGISPNTDPYAALRVKAYRFYALVWMVSIFTAQIQSVALGWDLYTATGDPMTLGWVALLQALPVMLLAIPAGLLADRFSRQKLLMLAHIGLVFTSAGLVYCSMTDAAPQTYFVVITISACFGAIAMPARQALLPLIVPREVFANAVMWNSSLGHIARISGPAIGGVILLYTTTGAYVANLIGHLAFALCLLVITTYPQTRSVEPVSLKAIMAGIRFIYQKKIIFATISLDLFAVMLGGVVYILPIVAQDILQAGPTALGWLRAAPGLGALVMALILAHRPPMNKAGLTMLIAVGGFGVATILFGFSQNLFLSLFALFITGALDNISVVIRHTLVQTLTPDEMRGRVSAVNSVFINASNEIGGFRAAAMASLLGIAASIVLGGIGTIAVVVGLGWAYPQLRQFGSLADAKALPLDQQETKTTLKEARK